MIKEANKQETHDSIIDAAERLLDRYGYAKMTMTDLAEEAGIGVGTTYLYFPGKLDVALAVLERLITQINTRLREIAASTAPAEQKIREMLTARLIIRFESARKRHHQIDEFKQAVKSTVEARRAGWQADESKIIAAVLEQGQHDGVFEFENASEMANTLMLTTSCLTPKNLSRHDFETPDEFYRKADQIVSLLIRGLRAPQKDE